MVSSKLFWNKYYYRVKIREWKERWRIKWIGWRRGIILWWRGGKQWWLLYRGV